MQPVFCLWHFGSHMLLFSTGHESPFQREAGRGVSLPDSDDELVSVVKDAELKPRNVGQNVA